MIFLVTGVAGFIGSHIAEELLKNKNHTVIGIDNFYCGKIENIKFLESITEGKFRFVELDIRNLESLVRLCKDYKVSYIFHQAAIASVQTSIKTPIFTNEVNVQGTLNILEAARINNVNKIVFASSASVYGEQSNLPINENSTINPISPYGLEKYICEKYLELYSNLFGLKSVVLRYFNVYGERQDPENEYSGVISIFTHKIKNNKSITVYGDGNQFRDFIYVRDVAKINIDVMLNNTGVFNIFCVGSGEKTSINSLINILTIKYNLNAKIIHSEKRIGDIQGSVCNNKKLLDFLDNIQKNYVKNLSNELGIKSLYVYL